MNKEKYVTPKIEEVICAKSGDNMCLKGTGDGNMCNSGGGY